MNTPIAGQRVIVKAGIEVEEYDDTREDASWWTNPREYEVTVTGVGYGWVYWTSRKGKIHRASQNALRRAPGPLERLSKVKTR